VLSYPRSYLRFAIGAFYIFIAISGLLATHPTEELRVSTRLATFGCANAAVMWWVVDAMSRRNAIPFASLWLGFWWFFTVPGYVIKTRSTGHALKRISQHALLALLAAVVGAVMGTLWW